MCYCTLTVLFAKVVLEKVLLRESGKYKFHTWKGQDITGPTRHLTNTFFSLSLAPIYIPCMGAGKLVGGALYWDLIHMKNKWTISYLRVIIHLLCLARYHCSKYSPPFISSLLFHGAFHCPQTSFINLQLIVVRGPSSISVGESKKSIFSWTLDGTFRNPYFAAHNGH